MRKVDSLFSCLAASAVLFGLESKTPAQLIAHESFSEMALGSGILGSGSDSFGWNAPWSWSGTPDSRLQIVDPTPDLSFQITGGKLITGGNRALLVTTNPEPVPSSPMIVRRFARDPRINTTIYLGLLLRIPISGNGTDSINIHLLSGDKTVLTYAIRPYENVPPSGYFWRLTSGGGGSAKPIPGDNSKSHLVVIESLRATSADEAYYFNDYIDPSVGYPGIPGGFAVFTKQIDGIGISVSSSDSGGPFTTVLLDEIKVGYRWRDIVNPVEDQELVSDLNIENAIKIRWHSQLGKNYQVQYSFDLKNWFNLGSLISGNNQVKEIFDSASSESKKMYRIQVK